MNKAIIGLGNPGPQLDWTRHNAGWRIIDLLAASAAVAPAEDQTIRSQAALWQRQDDTIVLAKPLTGMNTSGEAVRLISRQHLIAAEQILVIHDDVSLPMGKVRFQFSGSAGGQHGIESVINELGTRDFARLKLGVGPDPGGAQRFQFVLTPLSDDERTLYTKLLEVACQAAQLWATSGLQAAMAAYNGKNFA